jgi:hypothetical protein
LSQSSALAQFFPSGVKAESGLVEQTMALDPTGAI